MPKHSSTHILIPLQIARRYAFTQASAFSHVGRLAFLGLALSVSVLVIVVSVVNGFERELRERVLGLIPSLTIFHQSPGLSPEQQSVLTNHPDIMGSSPFVQGQVLLAKANQLVGAEVTGIDPQAYTSVTRLFDFTSQRDPTALEARGFEIILGAGLASQLEAEIGDDIRLVLPTTSISAAGVVPRQRRMKIVDILMSNSLLDAQTAYVHIDIAKRLFRQTTPQGWHLRSRSLFELHELSDAVFDAFGDGVRIHSWMDKYGSLYRAIAVQKLTMFVLLLFLVAVAAFNLISGLVMIVEQRKADVAVLMTIGLGFRDLLLLFVALGLMVAVGGIGIGLGLGGLVAYLLPTIFAVISEFFGAQLMSQYFIQYLPSEVRMTDLLNIGLTSFVLAGVATIFPAWRATRLLPTEVLSHE